MPVKSYNLPFRRRTLALALALVTGTSHAATINVNASCTLINAIHNANTDTDTDGTGGCAGGSSADTINLKANRVYTLSQDDNYADGEGENGLPSVTSVITINGNGATLQRSTDTGTPDFRLLHIAANGQLTVNNTTVNNGNISSYYFYGGAILNRGILALRNSRVINSHAENGGGIANLGGNLTVNNSTISGNKASAGAGIITLDGTTSLSDSTISGNKAFFGGGLMNEQATVTLRNSTVSGNKATDGGGISNTQSTVTLSNSTISGNKASKNGGLFNQSSNLTMIHSTVANNQGGGLNNLAAATMTNSLLAGNTTGDCHNSGFIILKGSNLIEDGTCNAALSGNPKLGPLLDNGGNTQTHAPQSNPAINKIDKTLCAATDQRHVSRPQPANGKCDIGAFERIGTAPPNVATTVQFFDAEVAAGDISGVKTGGFGKQQVNALRNQLLTAGDYQTQDQSEPACNQLTRTLARIGLNNTPDADDYVTGNQAGALIEKIETLRTDWACQ